MFKFRVARHLHNKKQASNDHADYFLTPHTHDNLMVISVLTFFIFYYIQTRAKYLSVGKQMKTYEDSKYEQWRESVEQVLPSLLKRNLIVKPTQAQQLQLQQQQADDNAGDKDGRLSIHAV